MRRAETATVLATAGLLPSSKHHYVDFSPIVIKRILYIMDNVLQLNLISVHSRPTLSPESPISESKRTNTTYGTPVTWTLLELYMICFHQIISWPSLQLFE